VGLLASFHRRQCPVSVHGSRDARGPEQRQVARAE
jgi:hypothetical protein